MFLALPFGLERILEMLIVVGNYNCYLDFLCLFVEMHFGCMSCEHEKPTSFIGFLESCMCSPTNDYLPKHLCNLVPKFRENHHQSCLMLLLVICVFVMCPGVAYLDLKHCDLN